MVVCWPLFLQVSAHRQVDVHRCVFSHLFMTLTARFKTFVCAVKVCFNLDMLPLSLVQVSFFQFFLMPSFHLRVPSWLSLGFRMEYLPMNSSRCVIMPR